MTCSGVTVWHWVAKQRLGGVGPAGCAIQARGKAKGRKKLGRIAESSSAAQQILLRPKNGFRH